jgi:cell division protein FtsQ
MRFLERGQAEPAVVRARRQRRAQRRLILIAAMVTALGSVPVGVWYLERSGTLDPIIASAETHLIAESAALHLTVQSVEVEGRQRAERQAVLDALRVRRGTPILDLDLDAAKMRLESIPWVHSAAVERLWPDTIYVRLVERQPLAVWQHYHKFDLIDQDGAVIPGAPIDAFSSLLQVVGDGAPQATAELLDLLAGEPALAAHVTAAVRIGARRWNLNLDDGIEVALPEDAAASAWHQLAALDHRDRILERDVKFVDLRLQDRVVLGLSPETAKSLIKKPRPARPDA